PDNVRKLNPGINTVGDYAKLVKNSVASGDLNISDVEPGQGDALDKMLFPDLFDDFEFSEYGELLPQPQAQQQMDQPAFQRGKAEPSKASGPLDFESKYAIPFQEEPAVSTNVPLSDEYKLKPLSESSPASVLGKKYRLNEDVQSGVLSQAKDPVAYEKEIKSGREIPSGRKKGITEIGGINALISGGRDVDTRVNANVDELVRSTMFQNPDALTEQRMKDYPEVMGSMIAGQVVPAFAGGAGLQKTLLGIPQVARLASAGKWGKTAFSAVTRSVASGTDFAIRSKEELTSTDPVVQKKAIGRLATAIAAAAASPLPEEFLPKGYIQPFAQAAADLVVQVAGDKYIGEDSFSEENIVNTIAGTITSGLFALNDIRKPNVKVKPNVETKVAGEPVGRTYGQIDAEAEVRNMYTDDIAKQQEKEIKDLNRELTPNRDQRRATVESGMIEDPEISQMKERYGDKIPTKAQVAKDYGISRQNASEKIKKAYGETYKPTKETEAIPEAKLEVNAEVKPEEPAVKAEQKPKPEVPKTETIETPDIDKADVPRVQTDTEPSQKKAVPASSKTEPEVSPYEIPEDAIPLPSKDDPSYFEVPEAGPARGSVRIGPGEKPEPKTAYRKQRPAKAFAEFYKRHFTKPGDLGSDVQAEKIAKSGKINKELKEVEYVLSDFRKAVKKEYGTTKLDKNTVSQLDEALKNEKLISSLPESIQPHVRTMRNHIDLLSKRLIDLGVVEGDLVATVKENLGAYATRSYRVFDDPKWAKHVKEKAPGLIERAKAFLRKELEIQNEELLDGKINELLSMKGGPIDFLISSGKIGSMNRSILKYRKDIPIEIRALWGEYKEPEVNYAKSVSKMISLIANHEFLN
ncbi:MAG: hypothetical protein WCY37_06285, partial [Candidatus Dojkabacteria bacterium]